MRISVVTPYFNGSRFLSETGQSLLNQTHRDWEWIIVDDGSHQDELHILEQWQKKDPRIRWEMRKGNPKGANRCRNQGWQSAQADFILFLDSDDMLMPHALEQRALWMRENPHQEKTIPYFQTVAFTEQKTNLRLWDDPDHPSPWLASLWSQTPPCQSSGPLWTPSQLTMIGGWAEEIRVWQDLEVHQRAYFQGIRFIPVLKEKPDILYRIHEYSLSHQNFHSSEKLHSRAAVLWDAIEFAEKTSLNSEEKQALALMIWSVYRNACQIQEWSLAEGLLKKVQHLPEKQINFLRRWKSIHKLRLNRLPMIATAMSKKAQIQFPTSKRRILHHPFS